MDMVGWYGQRELCFDVPVSELEKKNSLHFLSFPGSAAIDGVPREKLTSESKAAGKVGMRVRQKKKKGLHAPSESLRRGSRLA